MEQQAASYLHIICAIPLEVIRASIRYIMHVVVVATSCQYAEAYYLSTITIMWDRPDMSTDICAWWLVSIGTLKFGLNDPAPLAI